MKLLPSHPWRIPVIALAICLLLYLTLAAILYFTQESQVYFPAREIGATPEHVGVPFTPVSFTSADGVRLSGWFVQASKPKGTVLFCHGNGGNISFLMETVKLYPSLGYNLLVFDYRGYGESDGTPSEEGTYRDAEAAWDYLVKVRGILPGSIVLVGRSLGGAVAAWLAVRHVPHSLILESVFTSMKDLASQVYPYFPIRLMLRYRYETITFLRELHCPVLIIHSPDDEIVPFSHGRALFDAAKGPKEFLQISGGHNDGYLVSADRYRRGVRAFLARHSGM